jgi:hypothetical protein
MHKKFVAFKRSFLNAPTNSSDFLRAAPNVCARHSTESGCQHPPVLSIEVVSRFQLSLHKKHFALHNSLNCIAANFRQQLTLSSSLSSLTVPLDNFQSSLRGYPHESSTDAPRDLFASFGLVLAPPD